MADLRPNCSVDEVMITAELDRRPSRAPDFEAENRALALLAEAMGSDPDSVLQRLVETAMELTRSDSAGISLLEPGAEDEVFRWAATAGAWKPYRDGTMPREQSPCGEVVARESVLLVRKPDRAFPALLQADPLIQEALLAPFDIDGSPAGTVWVIKHSPEELFEREDARLLGSLGRFASVAHRMVQAIDSAQASEKASREAEATLRESEERQAFLLALADAMRTEPTANGKIAVAARHLGEKLNASRVLYAEYDHENGLAHIFNGWLADGAEPFPPVVKLEDFEGDVLNDLREGRVVRVDDVGRLAAEAGYAAIANVGVQALLSPPLLVDGTLKFNVSVHQHEPRHWSDGEVELVQEVSERLWAEIVRARTEAALRASEEKYRTIFESIDEGFALIEVILNDQGEPVDLLHIETNPAYERHTGLRNVVGKRVLEIVPDFDARWFDFYGEVARTGETARAEYYVAAPIDRWFTLHATRIGDEGSRKIAVVFNDFTDRKLADQTLRESEERQTFLLKLSDVVRAEPDPGAIIAAATRLLGEQLGATRVAYAEIDEEAGVARIRDGWTADGAPEHPAVLKLGEFGGPLLDDLRRGKTVRYDDVGSPPYARQDLASLAAIGIKAGISVPLTIKGQLVVNINVHQDQPRIWTDAEVALTQEVGERTWAAVERAKAEQALRDSEAHQKALLAELQHRVRNTLAVIRSIVRRTAATSDSVEQLEQHLDGRLGAFARTQTYVTRHPDGDVDLELIIRDELLAHASEGSQQITIDGPQVRLKPKLAETIGLAVHELTTNAVKHGALLDGGNKVDVSWKVEGKGKRRKLHFQWKERLTNRTISAPERQGFGTELLERVMSYELDAEPKIEFRPEGLSYRVSVPLSRGAKSLT